MVHQHLSHDCYFNAIWISNHLGSWYIGQLVYRTGAVSSSISKRYILNAEIVYRRIWPSLLTPSSYINLHKGTNVASFHFRKRTNSNINAKTCSCVLIVRVSRLHRRLLLALTYQFAFQTIQVPLPYIVPILNRLCNNKQFSFRGNIFIRTVNLQCGPLTDHTVISTSTYTAH